ncbi:MAG: ATP-binding protein [Desulfuromonadaceae bacterium]
MRQFNTAGPSILMDHYCINPLQRINLPEILNLIADKRYFVLHAPRQTGKTTCLLALMRYLNAEGHYRAVYVNVEGAQTARNNVESGMRAIAGEVAEAIRRHTGDNQLSKEWPELFTRFGAQGALKAVLERWTEIDPGRPTVLMIDEIDALVGDTLISVLRQIRAGYADRPEHFPISVILCGVRDVRDYRIHSGGGEIITGGSAFNIKAESLVVGNFTQADMRNLFEQHTTETGQLFEEDIFDKLWDDTAGQPWLVNALGQWLCFKLPEGKDRSRPITLELYQQAREELIRSRATHLDQLTDKLKEPRVHGVIARILAGDTDVEGVPSDDMQYVADMGLITIGRGVCISNAIYREIIPRELTWTTQLLTIYEETQWYVMPDKRLDISKLIRAFQQFFRENADAWIDQFQYKEAGPQLLLQAFLQRVINGGGRLTREYGLGMKRTDLYLEWPLDEKLAFLGPLQRVVFELKIMHRGLATALAEGLPQTAGYAAACGADEAHLVIFDRSGTKSWDDKIWERAEDVGGRVVQVWGM